jgi:N-formylglutamate amidohydrolase
MAEKLLEPVAYSRLGQVGARTPLVIAVPHAGRHYPRGMMAAARLPIDALETIEDRHADLLITDAVRAGAVAIVARTARAFVDLNRDEREIDPTILAGDPVPGALLPSAKVSGGLGVIPSRIAAGGLVWKRPFTAAAIEARLALAHRPYHAAIDEALDEALAVHGVAILLDCHSMPSIAGRGSNPGQQIVIGDRHGCSAGTRFVTVASRAARQAGLRVALNTPYAGGHTLDRHGKPKADRHAIQIELDRALYLDAAQRDPGAGLARARHTLASIAQALVDEAVGHAIAAE